LITLLQHKLFYHHKKGITSFKEAAYSSKDSGINAENESKRLLNVSGDAQYFEDSSETLEFDTMPIDDTKVILSWQHFTVDYTSLDKELDEVVIETCIKNGEELIDLRSYMIEHPETCT
jgi:hypothetical protein